MAAPPSELGAVNATVAWAFPVVAAPITGAPGALRVSTVMPVTVRFGAALASGATCETTSLKALASVCAGSVTSPDHAPPPQVVVTLACCAADGYAPPPEKENAVVTVSP